MISPIVSIIIPVYKVEQYLRQCLDSVINQTFKDIEIIIVNDCSPDNSLQIIKEYQQKDNRINLIDLKSNGGLANARNVGLKNSKGQYVVFIDSDDWISPNQIELLYTTIKDTDIDFVSSEFMFYNNISNKYSNGNTYFHCNNTIISDTLQKNKVLMNLTFTRVWGTLFNNKFLKSKNIYFRINRYEDYLFMWEAIVQATKIVNIDNKTYYYRVARVGSNVSTNSIYDRINFHNQLIKLNNFDVFKKYSISAWTFLSVDLAIMIEDSTLSFKELSSIFFKFKTNNYNNKYIVDFSLLNIRNKIRLYFFIFCLKHNLNYVPIGKIHKYCNPLRLLIKLYNKLYE